MKIFIYSDLHISKTSSIMPMHYDDKYTFRQHMIIETGKFLANIINQEHPDLIINLGDTFDQHTITSYDVDVASAFFKCFDVCGKIPHYVVVGNHEMVNHNYNAVTLLNNIPNIQVISDATSLEIFSERIAFLPYCDHTDILEFPDGEFLFSHQDIQGSVIRGDFTLPDGLNKNQLSRYKLVFNGHIHKSSMIGNVVNVGSITTHSFSDDDSDAPQCYVFDTKTMDLKSFKSVICPLFRKIEITNSINELNVFLANLDANYRYILQCTCPQELKELVKEILQNNQLIINSRINVKINKAIESKTLESITSLANINIKESFVEFLNTIDLKFPKQMYLDIIGGIN